MSVVSGREPLLTRPALFALGIGIGAWAYPLGHYLVSVANGRGLLYPANDPREK